MKQLCATNDGPLRMIPTSLQRSRFLVAAGTNRVRWITLAVLVLLTGCHRQAEERPSWDSTETPAPAPESSLIAEIEEGFRLLSLADFAAFQAEEATWREDGETIICLGTPKGYVYSREPFGNFTLRCEFRYVPGDGAEELEKSNTGFMIHIQEPHRVWPNSWEVQGRWDELCSIKANGGAAELTIHDRPEVRDRVRRPVDEWNSVEIVSKDGALTAWLNGELVCESEPGELTRGLLGLQSEGYEVHFRNLRVRQE